MTAAADLRAIFAEARPLIEAWLDIAEQMSALREAATAKGIDWSQTKALVKAQVQDERDETGDGKRVRKIIERADFASAYADMLGLGAAKMNEKSFSAPAPAAEPDPPPMPNSAPLAAAVVPPPSDADLEIPPFLRRAKPAEAVS